MAPDPQRDVRAAFRARLEEFGGRAHEAPDLERARALARRLAGGRTAARWADDALDGIAEHEATAAEAAVSLVVADVGVAATGAIGFAHGRGRSRAAAVLPPSQVALLAAERVVPTLADALALFGAGAGALPASVVFTAGPSRTADIEQRVVRGVHGPRELDVIVYGPAPP